MIASVKQPPALKKRVLSARQIKQPTHQCGRKGEQIARELLESKHYQILETNCFIGRFELDIIAIDTTLTELVFIEVRTRTCRYEFSLAQLSYIKLKAFVTAGKLWRRSPQATSQKLTQLPFRFDSIFVFSDQVSHFQNVTLI